MIVCTGYNHGHTNCFPSEYKSITWRIDGSSMRKRARRSTASVMALEHQAFRPGGTFNTVMPAITANGIATGVTLTAPATHDRSSIVTSWTMESAGKALVVTKNTCSMVPSPFELGTDVDFVVGVCQALMSAKIVATGKSAATHFAKVSI